MPVGPGTPIATGNAIPRRRSSASTVDLGRIGLTGGLATLQGCGAASTASTYPHGIRLCGAYIDQPLLNKHLDIQAGIIPENYQYANPFVGGSLSSGVLGPSASLLSELGLAANGIGAPAVNVTLSGGHSMIVSGCSAASS